MRIELDNPDLVDDLLAYLRQRIDTIASRTGPTTIEVAVLGSDRADGMEADLTRRLDAWEAQRAARARLQRHG